MSENIFGASYIRDNSDLFKEENDLIYGRVINVKFIRRDGTYFTIRSDYEPVYHNGPDGGTVEFARCSQKPSIKLAYNQVANTTAIEVKLQVDALYIDREMSGCEIDSSLGNPVTWAMVQLGYIGQFPDWRKLSGKEDLKRFYDLDNHMTTSDQGVKGGKQIVIQVLTAYAVNLPPDQSWVFNGVLGTLESGLRWDNSDAQLMENYGDMNYPKNMSEIESVLYNFVTRRFIRPSVEHQLHISEMQLGQSVSYKTEVGVVGYNRYKNVTTPDAFNRAGGLDTSNDFAVLTLAPDGAMSYEDANMFGVTCICSSYLKSMDIHTLYLQTAAGENAVFIPVDETPFNEQMDGVGPQLRAIQNHYQFLRWYELKDGSFFLYHVNEKIDDMFKDPAIKSKQKNDAKILPAVYDITMSGTRTIRCPFFSVIDPMTAVLFQSRFRLVDDTGYWYQPKKGMDGFLVLLASIEFSTTGDENMMTLMCTDISEDQRHLLIPTNGEVIVTPPVEVTPDHTNNVTQKQKERDNMWAEVSVTAGKEPFSRIPASWVDIAKTFLLASADKDEWTKAGKELSLEGALTDLKTWNSPPSFASGVWISSRIQTDKGFSKDNALVKPSFALQIPWLYDMDVIKYRTPYKPAYVAEYMKKGIDVNGS